MKIIIFGTGQMYRENRDCISYNDEIIGFLDNNQKLWGTKIDGKIVYNPGEILNIEFDKIILMSTYALDMKKQLLEIGCQKDKIMHYLEYMCNQGIGEMRISFPKQGIAVTKKQCLIITTELGYNGGSIAAVYAALALRMRGYEPVIASPDCDPLFMTELKKYEIGLFVYKNLSYVKENELFWIDRFDYVIVNTLQMSLCAIEIARKRRVILWIHEPHAHYDFMSYWKDEVQEGIVQENLMVYAVSSIAKRNFMENYNKKSVNILPYGIPDEYVVGKENNKNSFNFAMIGVISEQKGQDIFWKAIEKTGLKSEENTFLFIGKNLQDSCGQLIARKAQRYSNVRLLGELTHEDVIEKWKDIDVLVVSSREDMLPIVATEAFMFGKVCIISDATGTVDYIEDYTSGLVFSTENADELSKKLLWCVENRARLEEIGKEARKVYQSYFSMEVFGKNLERIINEEN